MADTSPGLPLELRDFDRLTAEIDRLKAALANAEAMVTQKSEQYVAERQNTRSAVLAEREAIAAWHDQQAMEYAENVKLAHHPIVVQMMRDNLNTHVRSAAAIRARPAP